MPAPKDIVWDTITNSAKTRFDYQSFSAAFEDLDNENIVDNVLFKVIVGLTNEQPHDAIVADISRDFLLLGIAIDKESLLTFVDDRSRDLPSEILATRIALASFDMGAEPPGVLVQIHSILNKS